MSSHVSPPTPPRISRDIAPRAAREDLAPDEPSRQPDVPSTRETGRHPSGRVVLFSGHMVDAPGRAEPRFPPSMVPAAAKAIANTLAAWNVGHDDLGMCGGACGGDLLFAESCLLRGASVELLLPFDIPEFIHRSVAFAGDAWVRRFHAVAEDARTRVLLIPDGQRSPSDASSPYTRHAHWMLNHAFAHGPDRVWFLCLWDSEPGDGPGGTGDILAQVRAHGGKVEIIDTTELLAEGTAR